MRKATLASPPVFRVLARDGARVSFESDSGAVAHVFVLEDDIVRVVMLPDGAMRQTRTWAIAPGAEDVAYEGRERFDVDGFSCPTFALYEIDGSVVVETALVRLSIARVGFRCRWSMKVDGDWREVARDRATYAYDFVDGRVRHWLARDGGEMYFGLGEKSGRLDRAGRRLRMRSTDAFGYDAETSDPLYKHVPFVISVLPRVAPLTRSAAPPPASGGGISYGIFYDTLSDCVFDLGCEISHYHGPFRSFAAEHGDLDFYFIAGPEVGRVTERFTWLTGKPAAMPRWALSYSGSTMAYTDAPDAQAQMLGFLAKLAEHRIPCGSFHLSSGYSSIGDKRYVFTWNTDKFPDARGFLGDYAKAGVRVVANIKPVLLSDHPRYAEVAAAGLFLKDEDGAPALAQFWGALGSYLDFTNPETIAWWKENVTRQLLDYGIAATWNDNNEYEIESPRVVAHGMGHTVAADAIKPLQPLLMMRASREAQLAHSPSEIPLVVSRAGMAGMQRYCQTWTGDNFTSWKTLKFNIRMGLGLALSGISNIGHDVGGFAGPKPDEELFLRWIGCGVFWPRFSIHSWNDDGSANEPWMYAGAMEEVRALFALREELVPAIAEALSDYRERYVPAVRPLFYDFPDEARAWEDTDDFLLGRAILVTPVVEPGVSTRRVWLPAGASWRWHWTGEVYSGGREVVVEAPVERPPFFWRV